jgi:hypothetical protein
MSSLIGLVSLSPQAGSLSHGDIRYAAMTQLSTPHLREQGEVDTWMGEVIQDTSYSVGPTTQRNRKAINHSVSSGNQPPEDGHRVCQIPVSNVWGPVSKLVPTDKSQFPLQCLDCMLLDDGMIKSCGALCAMRPGNGN